jgi:hypothetical protein
MRLPRVRFTVRRMMIAVAVVAILIGVGLQVKGLYQRFHECSRQASTHGFYGECLDRLANEWAQKDDRIESLTQAKRLRLLAEYQRRIKAKYEAAKWRPWIDVEPDPPGPEL